MNIDVISIVKDYVDEGVEVTGESNLIYDLGLTSYDVAMILNEIQEQYSVTVNVEKAREIKVVDDLLGCIE